MRQPFPLNFKIPPKVWGETVNLPITVSDKCPKCGAVVNKNYIITYIDAPIVSGQTRATFRCDHCDIQWNTNINLTINCKALQNGRDDQQQDVQAQVHKTG